VNPSVYEEITMKLFVVLAVLHVIAIEGCPGPGLLFPHMANNGDTEFTNNCDDCYLCVNTNGSYGVFDQYYNNICIGTNGYLTFGAGEWEYIPKTSAFVDNYSMVGTYWCDIYLPSNLPASHLWYRETNDKELRNRADKIIHEYFNDCGGHKFKTKYLFIVTWQRLGSYCEAVNYFTGCPNFPDATDPNDDCAGGVGKREIPTFERRQESGKPQGSPSDKDLGDYARNSFQTVVATDGDNTFVFNHIHTIDFECCFADTQMLFNAGDGVRFWKHPEPAYDCLACNSNAGVDGRWVYRVDEEHVRDPTCAKITKP